MSYIAFSQFTGDSSNFESDLEVARKQFTALGATRLSGSVALTGEAVGSITIATAWDTADGYFDARPQVVADPQMIALMQARGLTPVQTSFAEVYGETGTPEGKYVVSVIAVTEVHTPEATQAVVAAASNVMQANGVNGMRFARAIAAGQQSGIYVTLAYVDSLDDYLAASAAALADSAFGSAMSNAKGQIVMRQFNRML